MPPLPPLPSGATLRLATATADGVLGGAIWPAAAALCDHLAQNPQSVLSGEKNCIELGSGTGAVGLFAAALRGVGGGENKVVLTEHRPPLEATLPFVGYGPDGDLDPPSCRRSDKLLDLIRRNVEANADKFSVCPLVLELDWRDTSHADAALATAAPDGFDVVLASDVTYFSALHEALASTVARLLGGDGVAIVAHQERLLNFRGVDAQLRGFEQAAEKSGLEVQELGKSLRGSDGLAYDSEIKILELRHGQ